MLVSRWDDWRVVTALRSGPWARRYNPRMRTLLLAIWCALPVAAQRIDLADGWTVQSSAGGREYSTRVPSTVVGAMVANKALPDPYHGMNLRSYPGMGYDIGRMFANLPT